MIFFNIHYNLSGKNMGTARDMFTLRFISLFSFEILYLFISSLFFFISSRSICIYLILSPGFDEGAIFWNDANSRVVRGELPEGDYTTDTKIYYCCREDGFASNSIYLPTENPFYLLKKSHQCQKVRIFI